MGKKQYKNLIKNKHFLKSFEKKYKKCKNTSKFVKKLTGGQVGCLCEIIKNLCIGNIPIKSDTVKELKPYKNSFDLLKSKSKSIKFKKKILNQKGSGLFPIFLSSVLPFVIDFIRKKLE